VNYTNATKKPEVVFTCKLQQGVAAAFGCFLSSLSIPAAPAHSTAILIFGSSPQIACVAQRHGHN
jgi:hypothetical protein